MRKRPNERPKGLLIDSYVDLLPSWLPVRPKQPFSVPIRAWLLGPLREFAADNLIAPNAYTRQFAEASTYFKLLDADTCESAAAAGKLWSLLQLEIWDKTVATNMEAAPRSVEPVGPVR